MAFTSTRVYHSHGLLPAVADWIEMSRSGRINNMCRTDRIVGSLPWLLAKIPVDSGALQSIAESTTYLLFPGAVVGYIASLGRVHDVNFVVMIVSNCLIYSILTYWLIRKKKALWSDR